jgi:hypothetical protein
MVNPPLSKLPARIPSGFVRQDGAAFSHQLFDALMIEAEPEAEPDAVA